MRYSVGLAIIRPRVRFQVSTFRFSLAHIFHVSTGVVLKKQNRDRFFKPFPKQALVFTCMLYKSFENTVGEGDIARNEQFLLFPQCFLPIWRTFSHFRQTKNCRLLTPSVWKGVEFVVWERVKLKGLVSKSM